MRFTEPMARMPRLDRARRDAAVWPVRHLVATRWADTDVFADEAGLVPIPYGLRQGLEANRWRNP